MLPCTGCFKGISCPFYDSGLCERPYCHFKHVKKDSTETSSKSTSDTPAETGNMLQKLISDAVKKVLQHSDINTNAISVNDIESCNLSQSAVSKVIGELVPPLEPVPVPVNRYVPTTQVSYKPTPISELKKRHIPIPYSPSLMKSTKVLAKRPSAEPFPAKKIKTEPDTSAGFGSAIESPHTWSQAYIPTPMKSPSQGSSGEEMDAKFSSDESDTGGVEKELSVHRPFLSTTCKKQTELYVPTTIKSLDSSDYEPPSDDSAVCRIDYKPTNKSGSHCEPLYVPHRNNSTESSIYEPSTVSNIEPEYRPQCIPEAVNEYHPTSKSELSSRICEDSDDSISNEINLLGEILENDLKDEILPEKENLDKELPKSCGDKEPRVIAEEADTTKHHKEEDTHQQKVQLNQAVSSTKKLDTKDEKLNNKSEKQEIRLKKVKKSEKNEVRSERSKDKHKKAVESDRKHSGSSRSSHESRNKAEPEKKVNDIKRAKETSTEKKSERRHERHEHTKEKSSSKKTDTDSHPEKKIHLEKSVTKHDNGEHKNQKSARSNKESSHSHNKKHSSHRRGSSASEDSRSKSMDSKKSSKHKPKPNETCDKETSDNKKKKQDSSIRSSSSSNHRHKETSKTNHTKTNFDSKSGKSNLLLKSSCESSVHKQETAEKSISAPMETSSLHGRISEEQDFETGVDSAASEEESSSTDEDDVTKECLRIFQEYEPRQVTCVPEPVQVKEQKDDDSPIIGKKRVAHEAAQNASKKFIIPKKAMPNPGKVLAVRYMKARVAPLSDNSSTSCTPSPSQSAASTGGRIRVAHVQNVQLLLNAKKRMEALKTNQPYKKPVTLTVMHTLPKGSQRIAHTGPQDVKIRPTITAEVGGKIPAHIRQNYFNLLSSEYINFYHSEDEANEKAVEEEKNIYNRSSSRQVYTNLMLNRIQQIRREAALRAPSTSKTSSAKTPVRPFANRTVSHNAVLAGKNRNKGSWSIEKPKKQPEVPLNTYSCFLRHLMTEEDLRTNGFPRPHPEEKGVAVVYSSYKQFVAANNPLKRICDRCGKEYSVNSHGFAVKTEECINHWGRLYNMRINGSWQERYSCCNEGIGSAGCNHSDCHVSSNFNPNNLRGFVRTLPKETEVADGDYGVYALDCEMCYTTMGLELTRVTVIDREYKTIYETLVKPKNPIIDYNTRFSGITEEQLCDVTTSIYDVQSALLSFINSQTILIGHSLDSDFRALKLIHDTVVDTSIVFPHRRGPPYKRALKTLCNEYLSKNIQNSESGHDSAEDAKACMELMLWKIKQEGSSST